MANLATIAVLVLYVTLVKAFDPYHSDQLDYFSAQWKAHFRADEIQYQPKWVHMRQPTSMAYEVREYNTAFWLSSTQSCWRYDDATARGTFSIYLYKEGSNQNYKRFPKTSPEVIRVRTGVNNGVSPEARIWSIQTACSTSYAAMSYVQMTDEEDIPKAFESSIRPELLPQRLVYVKEFTGSYTSSTCEQHKSQLLQSLFTDRVEFVNDEYYCVKYPGNGFRSPKYEVWIAGAVTSDKDDNQMPYGNQFYY